MRPLTFGAAAVVLLALVAVPTWGDLGVMNVAIKIFIAAIFALGFNLLWGQAGLLSFGHAAYFGIGTFATIYLMQAVDDGAWVPTPLVPLAGALAGFLFGLVAGWFATIRSGVYFAMITVALAELVSALSLKWEGLFGGEAGVRSIRSPWGPFGFQATSEVYYLTLAWGAAVVILLLWLQRSPWGLVVRGIREREERVRFLGYDSHATKTIVFAVSAAISGLAGGLLAFSDESASMVLFQGSGSAFVVLNTVIGGAGVFAGPIVGAALTTSFSYYVANLTHFWLLYLGVLFVLIVMFAPQGLMGVLAARAAEVRGGRRGWIDRTDLLRLAGIAVALIGVVLLVEIVGAVFTEEYAAAILVGQGAWPPVRVLGIDWNPLSPLTWLAILVTLPAGIALLLYRNDDRPVASAVGRLRSLLLKPRLDP